VPIRLMRAVMRMLSPAIIRLGRFVPLHLAIDRADAHMVHVR
jgi:hypothetical protein